ncbi:DUF6088 family protein [Amaricoccus tamworthensis]|uniref:DUF6088 family protein n=1 Tax=Amaricoccus tamworthensis TaxID=57002 RepID=UPI003C79C3AE
MTTSNIKQRIIGKGRGAIFAPTDFLDIGSRASVDQALSRLADQGVIRRLARGLYDYPKKSPRFGFLSPSADDIAKAVARKDGQILQPSLVDAALICKEFLNIRHVIECGLLSGLLVRPDRCRWPGW